MKDVLLVGAGNALQATGKPWPWWRRHAPALGIELVRVGTASFARASDVLAAVERIQLRTVRTSAEVDEVAAMRERVRRAG